jgi:hypothetical protein
MQTKFYRSCRHDIKGWATLQQKGKLISIKAWTGPWESRRVKFRESLDNRHIKVERLSAVFIDCLYTLKITQTLISARSVVDRRYIVQLEWLSQWKIHVGNRIRDFLAFSAVPQPTTLLCIGIAIRYSDLHLKKYYGNILVRALSSFHLSTRSLEVYSAFVVTARHIENFLNCMKQLRINLVTTVS